MSRPYYYCQAKGIQLCLAPWSHGPYSPLNSPGRIYTGVGSCSTSPGSSQAIILWTLVLAQDSRWTVLLFLRWPLPTLHFPASLPCCFLHVSVDICPLASLWDKLWWCWLEIRGWESRVRWFPPDPSLLSKYWLWSLLHRNLINSLYSFIPQA